MPAYHRQIVYEDEQVQVVLITLPQGVETPIHDHGVSLGVVHILAGEISERYYRRDTCDWSIWEKHSAPATLREGAGHIHIVKNSGTSPAVMLNVYYPPLHMIVYAPEVFDYPKEG